MLDAAKPIEDGQVKPDAGKIESRQRAMVGRLPQEGMVIVILGGSHELRPREKRLQKSSP